MLQFGFYAWSWSVAGTLLTKVGYGAEYQVPQFLCITPDWDSDLPLDPSIHRLRVHSFRPLLNSNLAIASIRNVRPGRETWIQQNHPYALHHRPLEGLGVGLCSWGTFPCRFLVYLSMGRRSFRTVVDGLHVSFRSLSLTFFFLATCTDADDFLIGSLSNSSWSSSTQPSSSLCSTSYLLSPKATFAKGLRTLPANSSSPSSTCTKSTDLSAAPTAMRISLVFHGFVYYYVFAYALIYFLGCRVNTSSSLTRSSNRASLKRSKPSWVSFRLVLFSLNLKCSSFGSPRTRPLVLSSPY